MGNAIPTEVDVGSCDFRLRMTVGCVILLSCFPRNGVCQQSLSESLSEQLITRHSHSQHTPPQRGHTFLHQPDSSLTILPNPRSWISVACSTPLGCLRETRVVRIGCFIDEESRSGIPVVHESEEHGGADVRFGVMESVLDLFLLPPAVVDVSKLCTAFDCEHSEAVVRLVQGTHNHTTDR